MIPKPAGVPLDPHQGPPSPSPRPRPLAELPAAAAPSPAAQVADHLLAWVLALVGITVYGLLLVLLTMEWAGRRLVKLS